MRSNVRKLPRQARSRLTVDLILEATARIIDSKGWGALNTNAVSELAGVSVGSLYEYFPNKEAILVEFARRETNAHRSAVLRALAHKPGDLRADLAESLVGSLLNASDKRIEVRRASRQIMTQLGLQHELAESLDVICEYVHRNQALIFPPTVKAPSPDRLFVLTRAVSGVITAAVEERRDLAISSPIGLELKALVTSFLALDPSINAPAG